VEPFVVLEVSVAANAKPDVAVLVLGVDHGE
jgi:hypothetical protein